MSEISNDAYLLFPKLDHDKLEEHAIAREVKRRQAEKINELAGTTKRVSGALQRRGGVLSSGDFEASLHPGSFGVSFKRHETVTKSGTPKETPRSGVQTTGDSNSRTLATFKALERMKSVTTERSFCRLPTGSRLRKQGHYLSPSRPSPRDYDTHLQVTFADVLEEFLPKLYPHLFEVNEDDAGTDSQERESNDDGSSETSTDSQLVAAFNFIESMEPAAARSVPYVFENIDSVIASSKSLEAERAAQKVDRNESFETSKTSSAEQVATSVIQNNGCETEESMAEEICDVNLSSCLDKVNVPLVPRRKECWWTYPGSQGSIEKGASTIKPILPFTPVLFTTTGTPVSNEIAALRDLSKNSKTNSEAAHRKPLEEYIMRSPAPLTDLGPYFCGGNTARLQRRYNKQKDPNIFDMSHSLLGRHQIGSVVELLMFGQNQIRDLRLRNNGIDDLALQTLVKGLSRRDCFIKKLDLAENLLSNRAMTSMVSLLKFTAASALLLDAGQSQLAAVPPHGILEELILSGNKIGDDGADILCRGLTSRSAQLTKLDIANCGLHERSASHLATLLKETKYKLQLPERCIKSALLINRLLKRLNTSWNTFGVTGAKILAEGMAVNTTVLSLNVEWCGLRDDGCIFFARMLERNSTLEKLDISGNNLSLQTCSLLFNALQTNEHLQELGLRDSPLGVHGARKLLKTVASGDCCYVDLRGCSFLREHNVDHVAELSLKNPNGTYSLDLASASDRSLARQLLALAEDHGPSVWTKASLNKQPFNLESKMKNGRIDWEIPSQGQLTVKFVSKKRPDPSEKSLSDSEFEGVWKKLTSEHKLSSKFNEKTQDFQQHQMEQDKITQTMKPAKVFVTDTWKLELLEVLCWDYYFTCEQAQEIVSAFTYGQDKVKAASLVFGRIVDPENFTIVTKGLRRVEEELINESIGVLSFFHPDNPTGSYDLILGQQAHYTVARRLTELFCHQFDAGLCKLPLQTPLPYYNLEGKTIIISHPKDIQLPREGRLKVTFTDLRPPPRFSAPMNKKAFWIVLSKLNDLKSGENTQIGHEVSSRSVQKAVSVLQRFRSWEENAYRSKVKEINNAKAIVPALRSVAVQYYITASQLCDILAKIPQDETEVRVEVVRLFFARILNKTRFWKLIIDNLSREEQVLPALVCQRLGYENTFCSHSPEMHYILRMDRPDDYNVAHKLYKLSLNSQHCCIQNFKVDGEDKKVVSARNLWSVMKGNSQDGVRPDIVIEFDFIWPDTARMNWAATLVQAAWKSKNTRNKLSNFAKIALIHK